MGLAFVCGRCEQPIYHLIDGPRNTVECDGCHGGQSVRVAAPALAAGRVDRCLRCGHDQLYLQKDFNRKIGMGVFVVAAILSVPTWGLSLLAATLIDLGLYYLLGSVTICYSCGAQHRGFAKNPDHRPFDLHIAEAVEGRPQAV